MLRHIDLTKVLFLDIETVPQQPSFDQLDPEWQELWQHKAGFLRKDESSTDDLYQLAGIYSEFGKVVCISTGYLNIRPDGHREFRTKSYYGHDEREVLEGFFRLVERFFQGAPKMLCAHNGKEFDFPYLARRGVVHGLKIPAVLDTSGRKPWDVPHLDTLELWKFGDRKSFTALKLLAKTLGIASPKDDIEGKDVHRVYWQDNDLGRIERYCRKDVVTIAQVLLRFMAERPLTPDELVDL